MNVFAEYGPPRLDKLTLRAGAQNLFDADCADRRTYGSEYDGFIPLDKPGRTISLIAILRF